MVLWFAILFAAGALYDTMLWTLDAPGYHLSTTTMPASAVQDSTRPNPPYVLHKVGGDSAVLMGELE